MSDWQTDVDLSALTTFHVPAIARFYAEVHTLAELRQHWHRAKAQQLPVLILGGGSNMLFTQPFAGLVLRMVSTGIEFQEDPAKVLVSAAAGESWHSFVLHTLTHGAFGLENLALIPGTVGAAPVQNIGAYGVEVADVLHSLRAWDSVNDQECEFLAEDCAFGYRDSRFKQEPGRYVILQATFRLSRQPQLHIDYGDIRQELAAHNIGHPTPLQVATALMAIRGRKLPDPAHCGSAGSFFKNPILPSAQAETVLSQYPAAPHWPLPEGRTKLAAGWLIDQAGWKGYRAGDAGVYAQQALVLVNHGKAQGHEVWAIAQAIMQDIEQKFGIRLEPEPVIL